MAEWLIGRHAAAEALAGSARQVHEVWVLAGLRSGAAEEVRLRAQAAGVAVREIEARELGGVAPGATIAARCSAFRYRDEADLPPADSRVPALLVVLDGIQDPQNLGAIVRTAEAAGAVALCIPSRRAAQVTPAVVRASAGATEHLPVHRVTNIARTLERLKDLGYWTVGLVAGGTTRWDHIDYQRAVALVVGAEGRGLRRLVAAGCDHLATLQMRGRVQSLNASAAFAAAAYEVVRQQQAG